ncbi:MAG: hypothetical protein GC192_13270 [Bacteroidetes bacterium]|nr:hypothetical protein [Bacteroidota bacterium]
MLRYFQPSALLLSLLLLVGCASSNIRLKKNEYDNNVRFASNHLDGKRQKTKHVKKLETAFAQANKTDLHLIDSLQLIGTPYAWEKIHAIHLRMLKRQERVEPLLPLVSDDGYRPDIRLLPVREMAEDSRREVIERYFDQIQNNMQLARDGKKLSARAAYADIKYLQKKYDWDDPSGEELAEEALPLGTVYVLLEMENWAGFDGNTALQTFNFRPLSGGNFWQVVHRSKQSHTQYDFLAKTIMRSAWVYGESIDRNCSTVSEEILVRTETVTDTSGKVTYKPIYETATATICNITATKRAELTSDFRVYDFNTGKQLFSQPIWSTSSFCESFKTYSGDSRVSQTSGCRSSEYVSFPSDWQMMENCADDLRFRLCSLMSWADVRE